MLFHRNTQKGIQWVAAIVALLVIVSMIMLYMPGLF